MTTPAIARQAPLHGLVLKACIFATGLAGIVAEYVMATLASYLLGDAVLQWTLTVSLMLFAMGVGSRLSRFVRGSILDAFVAVELLLSVVCAISATLAYFLSGWTTNLAPVVYGLAFAIGLLIGVEIPLATRLNQEFDELRVNISAVLEYDYYGALLGGVLFAFVALPFLGLTYTPIAVGALNLVVAGVLFARHRRVFAWRRVLSVSFAGVSVFLIALAVFAKPIVLFGEQRKYRSIVTLTTVGFGDISPLTLGGRLIGVVLMFFGIGVLGMFTATIAGVFVEKRLRKERGMGSYDDLNGHIILCGWNDRTKEILKDLRADARAAEAPIALVADIDAKPVDDERLYFVRGDLTEEHLMRAGIATAATVVLVGDRSLEYVARDAKAVLSLLTVESLNPSVYSIVELASEDNVRHCERAGADEIIVGAEFSSRVISTATLDHGISTVLRELLSAQVGYDLITVPVPERLAGRPFFDVFCDLKRDHGMIAMAIIPHAAGAGSVVTNPPGDTIVKGDDRLVVVSAGERHAS